MSMSTKWSKNGNYYIDCMSVDDYYANTGGKEPPGEWYFAENAQGIRGEFGLVDGKKFEAEDTEAFDNLCHGFHPDTGAKLTQNSGDPDRRALLDCTFSPDKTVSSVWALAPEAEKQGIQQDQRDSVREALDFGSRKGARTRRVIKEAYLDQDGVQQFRKKTVSEAVAFIAPLWEHGSSRADDPQLHTHATILNLAVRADGTTGSIESLHLMKWQGAMASIYHAGLAYRLRQRGCDIVMTGNTFKVAGVPDHVCEAFSQRRKAIEAAVEKHQAEHGLTADAKRASRGLLQKATIETRDAKDEKTRDELQAEWTARGKELGFTEQEAMAVFQLGEPFKELTEEERMKIARLAVNDILETDATFSEPTLYTRVAVAMTGKASGADIERTVEAIKGELVQSVALNELTGEFEPVYTTERMLLIEQELKQLVHHADGKHKLNEKTVEAAITAKDEACRQAARASFIKREGREPTAEELKGLEEEQKNAVRWATLDDHTVSCVEGTAGSGKTFTMNLVGQIYTDAGYTVHGLSASWAAALNLKDEAELDIGRAITGWLIDVERGAIHLDHKSVVVVDEAGQVGVENMRDVIKVAQERGAKVILLGDTLQQAAVSAGDGLRVAVDELGSARMDIIRRQRSAVHRAAVPLFFNGKGAEALAIYRKEDRIHIGEDAESTMHRLVNDWQAARMRNPQRSQLIVAWTNKEVRELNRLAHDSRVGAGELDLTQVARLKTIDSQGDKDLIEFCKGDRVVFRTNNRNIKRQRDSQARKLLSERRKHNSRVLGDYKKGIGSLGAIEKRQARIVRELHRGGLSDEKRFVLQEQHIRLEESRKSLLEGMQAHFAKDDDGSSKSIAHRLGQALASGEHGGLADKLRDHRSEVSFLAREELKQPVVGAGDDPEEEAWANDVFNRVRGTVESIDSKTGVMMVRTDEGKLVEFDPQDKKWQFSEKPKLGVEPKKGLAIQHDYACTTNSSQGLTRDDVYALHGASANRRSGGVAASRHREDFNLYIDRQGVYEAKMRATDATEWHHISEFGDDECIGRVASTWSRKADKSSTLDFAEWRDAKGELVYAEEVLTLKQLADVREHVDQLRASQDAEPELEFQLKDGYRLLPVPRPQGEDLEDSRRYLMDELGVTSKVIAEAEKQGFLELRSGDELGWNPSFAGRRPGDGQVVNRFRAGEPEREEGALRDRYPPILLGDKKEVHIVARGEDALALWSMREREGKTKPTVIVAGGDVDQATSLKHVRDMLREPDAKVQLHMDERRGQDETAKAGKDLAAVAGKKVEVREEEAPAERLRAEVQQRAQAEVQEAEERKNKRTLGG